MNNKFMIDNIGKPSAEITYDNIKMNILPSCGTSLFLLKFYKKRKIKVKFRLLTKPEYQRSGSIVGAIGNRGSSIYSCVVLKDDKDNLTITLLNDIDHRTIVPQNVELPNILIFQRRDPLPPKKRFDILKRDNFTCQYCGKKQPEVELEIDHIFPYSRGGSDDESNLITSCKDCNRGKGNTI